MFLIRETFASTDTAISSIKNPSNIPLGSTLGDLLAGKGFGGGSGFSIINLIFVFVGLAFFSNLVMAGWDYLLSTGDPKKISAATSRITNGFIGLIMAMTAFILVNIITTIIGVKLL